ncbi:MAG: hypothetical protein JXB00_14420 [Bacteroidales bacterium]|nr:hypothetical protein [Bacteroidales bacterium]
METTIDALTSNLRTRIKKLISLYEETKTKNQTLELNNRELSEKNSILEKKLAETEKKYDNIKIAKTILATGDSSHDAKIKVNKIVREIDKCIALLNR